MLEDMLRAQQPRDFSTLFIDMDSFFASVEQQYNPALRGRPVGVCPCLGDNCIVVAASVEAKRFGIHVGTKLAEARRLCPGIVLISDSPVSYRAVHRQIMAVLDDMPCRVCPKSIDEAWLKLPWYLIGADPARQLAVRIRDQIAVRVGAYVGCSIGIGSNIWLAKMGASYDKPRGLVTVTTADLADFYATLQLTDLNGISWRLARQCYRLGIESPLQLYQAPLPLLRRAWGVNGVKWYLRLRGFEVDIVPSRPQQTLSHQTTIMQPGGAQTPAELAAVLAKMSYKLGWRLRRNEQSARRVGLYLRFNGSSGGWASEKRCGRQFASNQAIFAQVRQLLTRVPQFRPVKRVAVVLSDLHTERQPSLPRFALPERFDRVSAAIDDLNQRYGPYTIAPASSLGRDIFPDRIGFGNSSA